MKPLPKSSAKTPKSDAFPFAAAMKSFIGHLEGTHKAEHTIKNYRLDILAFESFLSTATGNPGKRLELAQLTAEDLERFHDHLKQQGLKNNTRRRKLMTVRKFLNYLLIRNKLAEPIGKLLLTPHKVERLPAVVPLKALIDAIRALPTDTEIHSRNRTLLWVLAETGCIVSEATRLRFEDWRTLDDGNGELEILGKNARKVLVSSDLLDAAAKLRAISAGREYMFLGFNKFGPLKSPITSRGVELLVRVYAERLGFPDLTPRTFRHSAVISWHERGYTQAEIQARLGLRSAYAFRTYEQMFKANAAIAAEAASEGALNSLSAE
jgi:site-specific recombinase XerD